VKITDPTTVELLSDLVYVFSAFQITGHMACNS
jgi:hypothetical protein